jgi:serine/threonine-protein kinase
MTSEWPPLAGAGQQHGELAPSPEPVGGTPTPPVALGEIVAGKYRIDGTIGFGGMGVVCAATHLELGTPIAIKFVRPEKAGDERASARFLTEARAAAKLQSQHACRIIDCGRLPTGSPYIVMEHLSGQDLRLLIDKSGPLPIADAVLLILQACDALAEAHSKHIVHRDVKPENLFIATGPGGAPVLKVLDFGISKQLSSLIISGAHTDSHESAGSPFHMSPEQMLEPATVDSRTDIWSLGVVLYEAITGQLPFSGKTAPQLCANVMTTEPIWPPLHREEIPDGLARVILRCLQKDRELRYRDVGELSSALKEFGDLASELVATRVEQILGRAPSEAPRSAPRPTPSPPSNDTEHPVVGEIPGVPRKGLGLRVSVALVVAAAGVLTVFGARRAVKPHAPEATPLPAAAAPAAQSEPVSKPASAPPGTAESPPAPSRPEKRRPVVKPQVRLPVTAPAASVARPRLDESPTPPDAAQEVPEPSSSEARPEPAPTDMAATPPPASSAEIRPEPSAPRIDIPVVPQVPGP